MTIPQISLKNGMEPTPEAFLEYLNQNWSILAAYTYAGYLRSGRGVLWVDWLNQLPITSPISSVPAVYCTPHSAIAKALFPNGMSDDLRRLMRQYDPETMIVVRWFDGQIHRTRTVALAGDAAPKQAYEQMKGRLSEFEMLAKVEKEKDRNG